MLSIFYVAAFVGSLIGLAVAIRYFHRPSENHTLLQPLHLGVTLYCAVNILICIWEIALYVHIHHIKQTFEGYKKKLEAGQLPSPLFLFQDVPLREAFSLKHWHDVWATYSLLDVSYSQVGSFGFNIDVGNGFSTLLPSLAFLAGSTDPALVFGASARQLGLISALFFYQAMYGTFVYFFQYVNNARWDDHKTPTSLIIALVGGSNGFWIVGPSFALYACYRMVMEDSVAVFYE